MLRFAVLEGECTTVQAAQAVQTDDEESMDQDVVHYICTAAIVYCFQILQAEVCTESPFSA